MITTNITVELEQVDYENFATLNGYKAFVVDGVDEKGVEKLVANPFTKVEYAQEALRAIVKQAIANFYVHNESQRLDAELKAYKTQVELDVNSAVIKTVK